ncbi:MAG: alpha/beta hydrolase [Bacteroidetes bacterium]|nr:alpha/beta hydrolase [Bacteroidota bacterium]
MYKLIQKNELESISKFYDEGATVNGYDAQLNGINSIKEYWKNVRGKGVDWTWEIFSNSGDEDFLFQTGISHLTLSYNKKHTTYSSLFSVIWKKQPNGEYHIISDFYRAHDQFSIPSYEVIKDSVWIQTPTDTLFAIIFKPKLSIDKKLPAIYCLQGGGNIGMDNYFYEAELFASAGFVSLVCDKSGAGKSKGNSSWVTQTFTDKTQEYSYVLNWIFSQPYIDTTLVGVHGPSEGGRLALSLALANPMRIKFVNAVSAPLETLKENQLYAIEKLLISQGYNYSVIAQTLELFNEYFEAIKNKKISKDLMDRVNKLREQYPKLYLPLNSTELPRMPQSTDIDYTYGTDIHKLNCPIYFQYGANDAVVNVANSLKLIPAKDNITIKIYKDTDHSINYPNGDTHGGYHIDKLKWLLSIITK